ncbi:NAD(P)/FAD-dependent oxidoreductase [Sphingomonas colocasiae]|uniref:FAD-dependent oxidoreductase n=1 Tax=Sphingomonas colocasiae TaxID=1848973 RepID=A0ABS7PKZ5_9SPHN|nr:FAD-dependent oxidoreductase [Sphingomonas colocasiae]MBY8821966.1 FAD-dependent oxidoreductase [Sphingomonas colocasiae]
MSDRVERIVIVGAGQAGGRAASELRGLGFAGSITILGDEARLPYERPPLSKVVLAGDARAEDAPVNPAAFYEEQGIELRLDDPACAIDRAGSAVSLGSGETIPYDRLILATGVRPRALRVAGADMAGIFSLRTAADAERIGASLATARSVAIVGGGFVGLEVASLASARGLPVTVIERAGRCLSRVVPPLAAGRIAARHLERNVRIRCDAEIAAITGDGRVEHIELADGERVAADLVIVGIGSRPQDDLALAAGLACADGVLVDARGRTSDPAIHAIGDVARHGAGRHESWQNAEHGAARAASSIMGLPLPADDAPWFWTDQQGWNVQLVGAFVDGDDVREVSLGPESFVHLHVRDGRLAGAVLFNAGRERRKLTRMIGQAASFDQIIGQQTGLGVA